MNKSVNATQLFEAYQSLPSSEKESVETLLVGSWDTNQGGEVPQWQKDEVRSRIEKWNAGISVPISKEEAFRRLGWD